MCFVLYVGTEKALPRKPWDKEAPDLCVQSLTESDNGIRMHFSKPEVQNVGSTSGCGCHFPHAELHNEEWIVVTCSDSDNANERFNRKRLVELLKSTRESFVELYGVMFGDFEKEPRKRESISVKSILDRDFFFMEQILYRVEIS